MNSFEEDSVVGDQGVQYVHEWLSGITSVRTYLFTTDMKELGEDEAKFATKLGRTESQSTVKEQWVSRYVMIKENPILS